jgi:hypothetical protein
MCNGFFRGSNPYVLTILLQEEEPISFFPIIDTGSHVTTLSYDIAKAASIDLGSLDLVELDGVGGTQSVYELNQKTIIGFIEDNNSKQKIFHREQLDVIYVFPQEAAMSESILGWDILERFELKFNKLNKEVDLIRLNVPPETLPPIDLTERM